MTYTIKKDGKIYKSCDSCHETLHELTAKEKIDYQKELNDELDEEPEPQLCETCEENSDLI